MKKNVFIATSILYSFFLIFVTLFIALILNYLHNKVLIGKINEDARNTLVQLNETKLTDLKAGESIRFDLSDTALNCLNEDYNWTVAFKRNIAGGTTQIILFGHPAIQKSVVNNVILPGDTFARSHIASIDTLESLMASNSAYTAPLKATIPGVSMNIGFVTSSALRIAKSNPENIPEYMMDNIFDTNGEYVVYADESYSTKTYPNLKYSYNAGTYYNFRKYQFRYGEIDKIYNTYCGVTPNVYNSSEATKNNYFFSYISENQDLSHGNSYYDYCYYSIPVNYEHNIDEKIVDIRESRNDTLTNRISSLYTFRLMATLTVDSTATDIYMTGGRGTTSSPYIFTNGVKE